MNQRLDHTNYEAWLLDRAEGNLTPEQEARLTAFLVANPQLDPGHETLPSFERQAHLLPALDKEALKRTLPPAGPITAATLDDLLIARMEGELSPQRAEELERFLATHPALQRSAGLMAQMKVKADPVVFASKDALARHLPPIGLPTADTLNDHLVALLEGDLAMDQVSALEGYLTTHPDARHQLRLLERTRVNSSAVYPDKPALKKEVRVVPIGAARWAARLSVAASIAVLIAVGAFYLNGPQLEGAQVADGSPAVLEVQNSPSSTEQKAAPSVLPEEMQNTSTTMEKVENEGPSRQASPGITKKADSPVVTPERSPGMDRTVPSQRPLVPEKEPLKGHVNEEELAPSIPAQLPEQPELLAEVPAEGRAYATTDDRSTTLGALLANTVRERVLDRADGSGPLNSHDALAAVDRGLKVVGGDRAGLVIRRTEQGSVRTFNLKLGRNLGISARR